VPTLEGLTTLGLRFADPQDATVFGDRAVIGIWSATDSAAALADTEHRGKLLVAPDASPWLGPAAHDLLHELADAGISALALTRGTAPAGLADMARTHHIPLLILNPSVPVPHLIELVEGLRQREEEMLRHQMQQLHGHAREMASGRWETVVRWLQQCLEPGKVILASPYDEVVDLPVTADTLAGLRTGRRDAASLQSGPWTIRLYALGKDRPRSVLIVGCAGPSFGAAASQAVGLALPFLELALEVREAREIRQASEQDRRRTDALLLRLLISGDVRAARHAAQPLQLSPRLMTARTARLYQFRTPADQRDELIAACECILRRDHLIVRDPTTDTETTVIARDDDAFTVEPALRAVLADRPDHHLGISRRVPLQQIPVARDEAALALDAAVQGGLRVGDYDSVPDLSPLLLGAPAHAWASRFFAPLADAFDDRTRRSLIATAALWLRYGTRGVVRVSRISENTVRAHIRQVEDALDLNLSVFGHRVVLDLATRISLLPEPPQSSTVAPTMVELFESPLARQWADRLLSVIPADDRRIRRTLITWLAAGGHSATAASTLRMHRKSVNIHLAVAESALGTRLLAYPDPPSPGGRHGPIDTATMVKEVLAANFVGPTDVALAALALGELPYRQLNRSARHRLEVFDRATTTLSATPDAIAAAEQLAEAMMSLGDSVAYVTVNLTREVFTGQEPPQRLHGSDVGLRRAALAARQGRTWREGFLQPGDDLPPLPDQPTILRHLRGEALWLPDLETIAEALDHRPDLMRALIPDSDVTALIHSPLKAHGRVIGSIEVWGAGSTPFVPDDLQLLTEITSHAAASVDIARRACTNRDSLGPVSSRDAVM
jgi:hypothetical protein